MRFPDAELGSQRSADADFGELLAVSGGDAAVGCLAAVADHLNPDQQATLLVANLPIVADELEHYTAPSDAGFCVDALVDRAGVAVAARFGVAVGRDSNGRELASLVVGMLQEL